MSKIEKVAVSVISRNDEILFARRPEGKPWAGWWELPGGKIEANESVEQSLRRELKEELGIDATKIVPWVSLVYQYPEKTVHLNFCRVLEFEGTPQPLEQQTLSWSSAANASQLGDLLPASAKPLRWLELLPPIYQITQIGAADNVKHYLQHLTKQLENNVRLVQFREPNWQGDKSSLEEAMHQVLQLCRQYNAKLLINSCHPRAWWKQADGVQLRAVDALLCDERPLSQDYLVGVSSHNLADLLYANIIEADFAVLGHILPTPSHAQEPALGWETFSQWREQVSLPIYAIGGQNSTTFDSALAHGAHGIAGIRLG